MAAAAATVLAATTLAATVLAATVLAATVLAATTLAAVFSLAAALARFGQGQYEASSPGGP